MTADERAAYELKTLIVAGARISWEVPHARERAALRSVPVFLAERIIRAVAALRVTTASNGSQTWRVSGVDADDRPIDVVVYPAPGAIRVITVIRTDE